MGLESPTSELWDFLTGFSVNGQDDDVEVSSLTPQIQVKWHKSRKVSISRIQYDWADVRLLHPSESFFLSDIFLFAGFT